MWVNIANDVLDEIPLKAGYTTRVELQLEPCWSYGGVLVSTGFVEVQVSTCRAQLAC